MRRNMVAALIGVLACIMLPREAMAQPAGTWPTRPIRLITTSAAGTGSDILARAFAERISSGLKQPIVIDNRPGANGMVATRAVIAAPPDGYTLFACNIASLAVSPAIYRKLPYDPVKDFEPVVYTHVVPLLLAVHPSVPAKSVAELVTWIKANPDKANYASSGTGSSLHMAAELFMGMTKTKMLHVPYKGSSAAHPDLIGGRTMMIFDTVSAIQAHVKSGAVRGLAVTTLERSGSFPDLPTISEAALKGYDASTWGGILAPARTPKEAPRRARCCMPPARRTTGTWPT